MALHEAVKLYAPDAEILIKWPNDLLWAPAQAVAQLSFPVPLAAKLSGILLERTGECVVIGFGVNLAHKPEALDRPTASLADLTGAAPAPPTFLETLADIFARWLGRWRSEGLEIVRAAWMKVAHPIGTALTAQSGGEKIEGLFDGLDDQGALKLRIADGSTRIVTAGDVFLI